MGDGEEHSRTALASELLRQKRAAMPRRGWAPERLSCSKTSLTKLSADTLVYKEMHGLRDKAPVLGHVCWLREGVPVEDLERSSPAFAGRGVKLRTQGPKKRTYSPTETAIQNPDLGVKKGGLEHEKASSGRWVASNVGDTAIQPNGNQNPDPRSRGENESLEYDKSFEKVEGGAPNV